MRKSWKATGAWQLGSKLSNHESAISDVLVSAAELLQRIYSVSKRLLVVASGAAVEFAIRRWATDGCGLQNFGKTIKRSQTNFWRDSIRLDTR
jgi:hypothetical protein